MWNKLTGKNSDAASQNGDKEKRRSRTGESGSSRSGRRAESVISTASTTRRSEREREKEKDRDKDDGERKKRSSTSRTNTYPPPESVASSYATAPSTRDREERTPRRSATMDDGMSTYSYENTHSWDKRERDDESVYGDRDREREERRRSERESDSPRDREERRKERRERRETERKDPLKRDSDRKASRAIVEESSRAGEDMPGGFPGASGTPTSGPARPELQYSTSDPHVAHQFPGMGLGAPISPYGEAADYYGDQGQSVAFQPGMRPDTPLMNAQPHLMAASAQAVPAQDTGNGTAADYFTEGAVTAGAISGAAAASASSSSKPSKPGQGSSSKPSKSSSKPSGSGKLSSAAAVAAGGAALGYALNSGAQESSSSLYVHGAQEASSNAYQQSVAGASSPGIGGHAHSLSAPSAGTYGVGGDSDASPRVSPSHSPSRPGKSNYGKYAAGAAGLAAGAYALHNHNHSHHQHTSSAPGGYNGYNGYDAQGGYGAGPSGYNNGHNHNHNHNQGYTAMRSRNTGPVSKLVDWWKDHEDVAKMEEYTEYIGVCRGCFDPNTSAYMAPRQHHYRKRKSTDSLRERRSGEFERAGRVSKDSRYSRYGSDEEKRRKSNKGGWIAAGLGAYGLAKAGKAVLGEKGDFEDTYSVRSGHRARSSRSYARHGSRSRSSSRDRRSSYGVLRKRSTSRDRRSNVDVAADGKGEYRLERRRSSKKDRSRSSSRDRKGTLLGAAAGAALAGSAIAASKGRKHRDRSRSRSRSHSPTDKKYAYVRRHRGNHDDVSVYATGTSRHRGSRASLGSSREDLAATGGFLGGIFGGSGSDRRRRISPKRKKKTGFFTFGNGSSSSDVGLAYGADSRRSKRSSRSSLDGKSKVKRKSSDEKINATLLGIGATAAALAAAQHSRGKHGGSKADLFAVKERKGQRTRGALVSKPTKHSSTDEDDEGVWEDDPNDSSGFSDDGLAYGDWRARKSTDSLASNDSGTWKWGWRWGRKKKRPSRESLGAGGSFIAPVAAGAAAGVVAANMTGRPDGEMSSISSQPSMQYMDPVMSNDPTRYDAVGRRADSLPMYSSRPESLPLNQPQPYAPVNGAVYASGAGYVAPSGPPVDFSSPPLSRRESREGIVNKKQRPVSYSAADIGRRQSAPADDEQAPQLPSRRRRASSPVQNSSNLGRNALIGGAAAAAGIAAASALSSSSSKAPGTPGTPSKDVRFSFDAEQAGRERDRDRDYAREARRREEEEETERRKREEDRRLREEQERARAYAREEEERARERRREEEAARRDAERKADVEREAARRASVAREAEERQRLEWEAERRRREREIADKEAADREAAAQAARAREAAAKEEERRLEQERRDREAADREFQKRENERRANWAAPVAAGAAGIAAAAAISALSDSSRDKKKDKKRQDSIPLDSRYEVYRTEDEPSHGTRVVEPKVVEPQVVEPKPAVREIKPIIDSKVEVDGFDDDVIFDPDYFKKARDKKRAAAELAMASRAADKVVADMKSHYDEGPVDNESFWAPAELKDHTQDRKLNDPNADADVEVLHEPNVTVRGPPYDHEYSFTPVREVDGRALWAVPQLKLIEPTPPASRANSYAGSYAGSARGSVPASPVVEPQAGGDPVGEELERSRSGSRVRWGQDQTHIYEAVTPESIREKFISDDEVSPKPSPQAADEIVVEEQTRDGEIKTSSYKPAMAAAAAAAAAYGISKELVESPVEEELPRISPLTGAPITEDGPVYRSQSPEATPVVVEPNTRTSHRSGGFYNQPFYDSISDIATTIKLDEDADDLPTREHGFVEGEVNDPTPKEEKDLSSGMPGGFIEDEEPAQPPQPSSKKQKKKEKKRQSRDVQPEPEQAPEPASKLPAFMADAPSGFPVATGIIDAQSRDISTAAEDVTKTAEREAVEDKLLFGESTVDEDAPAITSKKAKKKDKKKNRKSREIEPEFERDIRDIEPAAMSSSTAETVVAVAAGAGFAGIAAAALAREKEAKDIRDDYEEKKTSSSGVNVFDFLDNGEDKTSSRDEEQERNGHLEQDEPRSVGDSGYISRYQSVPNISEEPVTAVAEKSDEDEWDDSRSTRSSRKKKKRSSRHEDDMESSFVSTKSSRSDDYYEEDDKKSRRRSKHDDDTESPRRYAASEFGDEDSGKKKRRSKRDSEIRDDVSVASTSRLYDDDRERRKRSKRDSEIRDDVSVASTSVLRDEDKRRSREKDSEKGKKGGLFGIFSSSKDKDKDDRDSKKSRSSREDDDDRERRRKKRSGRSNAGSDDEDDERHRSSKSDRSSRSAEDEGRSEKRRSRSAKDDYSIASDDIGHTHDTDHPYSRYSRQPPDDVVEEVLSHTEDPELDTSSRRSKRDRDSKDQSFLGVRAEDESAIDAAPLPASPLGESVPFFEPPPALPDLTVQTASPDLSREMDSGETGWPSLPASRPTSPIDVGRMSDLPMLPDSRPGSPDEEAPKTPPRPSLESLRAASKTAVPFRFRYPNTASSPVVPREMHLPSPATTASPSTPFTPLQTPRTRHSKSLSGDLTREYRPLYLVEKTRKTPEVEDNLPPLPDSASTSRTPSLHDTDDESFHSAVQSPEASFHGSMDGQDDFFSDRYLSQEPDDLLGSQQTTPKAATFPSGVMDLPPQRNSYERDLAVDPEETPKKPREPSPSGIGMSELAAGVALGAVAGLAAHGIFSSQSEDTKSERSFKARDVDDFMGGNADEEEDEEYKRQVEEAARRKAEAEAEQQRSPVVSKKAGKKGKKGKRGSKTSFEETPAEPEPTDQEIRERDAQDAVDSWFEAPAKTRETSKDLSDFIPSQPLDEAVYRAKVVEDDGLDDAATLVASEVTYRGVGDDIKEQEAGVSKPPDVLLQRTPSKKSKKKGKKGNKSGSISLDSAEPTVIEDAVESPPAAKDARKNLTDIQPQNLDSVNALDTTDIVASSFDALLQDKSSTGVVHFEESNEPEKRDDHGFDTSVTEDPQFKVDTTAAASKPEIADAESAVVAEPTGNMFDYLDSWATPEQETEELVYERAPPLAASEKASETVGAQDPEIRPHPQEMAQEMQEAEPSRTLPIEEVEFSADAADDSKPNLSRKQSKSKKGKKGQKVDLWGVVAAGLAGAAAGEAVKDALAEDNNPMPKDKPEQSELAEGDTETPIEEVEDAHEVSLSGATGDKSNVPAHNADEDKPTLPEGDENVGFTISADDHIALSKASGLVDRDLAAGDDENAQSKADDLANEAPPVLEVEPEADFQPVQRSGSKKKGKGKKGKNIDFWTEDPSEEPSSTFGDTKVEMPSGLDADDRTAMAAKSTTEASSVERDQAIDDTDKVEPSLEEPSQPQVSASAQVDLEPELEFLPVSIGKKKKDKKKKGRVVDLWADEPTIESSESEPKELPSAASDQVIDTIAAQEPSDNEDKPTASLEEAKVDTDVGPTLDTNSAPIEELSFEPASSAKKKKKKGKRSQEAEIWADEPVEQHPPTTDKDLERQHDTETNADDKAVTETIDHGHLSTNERGLSTEVDAEPTATDDVGQAHDGLQQLAETASNIDPEPEFLQAKKGKKKDKKTRKGQVAAAAWDEPIESPADEVLQNAINERKSENTGDDDGGEISGFSLAKKPKDKAKKKKQKSLSWDVPEEEPSAAPDVLIAAREASEKEDTSSNLALEGSSLVFPEVTSHETVVQDELHSKDAPATNEAEPRELHTTTVSSDPIPADIALPTSQDEDLDESSAAVDFIVDEDPASAAPFAVREGNSSQGNDAPYEEVLRSSTVPATLSKADDGRDVQMLQPRGKLELPPIEPEDRAQDVENVLPKTEEAASHDGRLAIEEQASDEFAGPDEEGPVAGLAHGEELAATSLDETASKSIDVARPAVNLSSDLQENTATDQTSTANVSATQDTAEIREPARPQNDTVDDEWALPVQKSKKKKKGKNSGQATPSSPRQETASEVEQYVQPSGQDAKSPLATNIDHEPREPEEVPAPHEDIHGIRTTSTLPEANEHMGMEDGTIKEPIRDDKLSEPIIKAVQPESSATPKGRGQQDEDVSMEVAAEDEWAMPTTKSKKKGKKGKKSGPVIPASDNTKIVDTGEDVTSPQAGVPDEMDLDRLAEEQGNSADASRFSGDQTADDSKPHHDESVVTDIVKDDAITPVEHVGESNRAVEPGPDDDWAFSVKKGKKKGKKGKSSGLSTPIFGEIAVADEPEQSVSQITNQDRSAEEAFREDVVLDEPGAPAIERPGLVFVDSRADQEQLPNKNEWALPTKKQKKSKKGKKSAIAAGPWGEESEHIEDPPSLREHDSTTTPVILEGPNESEEAAASTEPISSREPPVGDQALLTRESTATEATPVVANTFESTENIKDVEHVTREESGASEAAQLRNPSQDELSSHTATPAAISLSETPTESWSEVHGSREAEIVAEDEWALPVKKSKKGKKGRKQSSTLIPVSQEAVPDELAEPEDDSATDYPRDAHDLSVAYDIDIEPSPSTPRDVDTTSSQNAVAAQSSDTPVNPSTSEPVIEDDEWAVPAKRGKKKGKKGKQSSIVMPTTLQDEPSIPESENAASIPTEDIGGITEDVPTTSTSTSFLQQEHEAPKLPTAPTEATADDEWAVPAPKDKKRNKKGRQSTQEETLTAGDLHVKFSEHPRNNDTNVSTEIGKPSGQPHALEEDPEVMEIDLEDVIPTSPITKPATEPSKDTEVSPDGIRAVSDEHELEVAKPIDIASESVPEDDWAAPSTKKSKKKSKKNRQSLASLEDIEANGPPADVDMLDAPSMVPSPEREVAVLPATNVDVDMDEAKQADPRDTLPTNEAATRRLQSVTSDDDASGDVPTNPLAFDAMQGRDVTMSPVPPLTAVAEHEDKTPDGLATKLSSSSHVNDGYLTHLAPSQVSEPSTPTNALDPLLEETSHLTAGAREPEAVDDEWDSAKNKKKKGKKGKGGVMAPTAAVGILATGATEALAESSHLAPAFKRVENPPTDATDPVDLVERDGSEFKFAAGPTTVAEPEVAQSEEWDFTPAVKKGKKAKKGKKSRDASRPASPSLALGHDAEQDAQQENVLSENEQDVVKDTPMVETTISALPEPAASAEIMAEGDDAQIAEAPHVREESLPTTSKAETSVVESIQSPLEEFAEGPMSENGPSTVFEAVEEPAGLPDNVAVSAPASLEDVQTTGLAHEITEEPTTEQAEDIWGAAEKSKKKAKRNKRASELVEASSIEPSIGPKGSEEAEDEWGFASGKKKGRKSKKNKAAEVVPISEPTNEGGDDSEGLTGEKVQGEISEETQHIVTHDKPGVDEMDHSETVPGIEQSEPRSMSLELDVAPDELKEDAVNDSVVGTAEDAEFSMVAAKKTKKGKKGKRNGSQTLMTISSLPSVGSSEEQTAGIEDSSERPRQASTSTAAEISAMLKADEMDIDLDFASPTEHQTTEQESPQHELDSEPRISVTDETREAVPGDDLEPVNSAEKPPAFTNVSKRDTRKAKKSQGNLEESINNDEDMRISPASPELIPTATSGFVTTALPKQSSEEQGKDETTANDTQVLEVVQSTAVDVDLEDEFAFTTKRKDKKKKGKKAKVEHIAPLDPEPSIGPQEENFGPQPREFPKGNLGAAEDQLATDVIGAGLQPITEPEDDFEPSELSKKSKKEKRKAKKGRPVESQEEMTVESSTIQPVVSDEANGEQDVFEAQDFATEPPRKDTIEANPTDARDVTTSEAADVKIQPKQSSPHVDFAASIGAGLAQSGFNSDAAIRDVVIADTIPTSAGLDEPEFDELPLQGREASRRSSRRSSRRQSRAASIDASAKSMPGLSTDAKPPPTDDKEFAAVLAAGLKGSGFDADIVQEDQIYAERRSATPESLKDEEIEGFSEKHLQRARGKKARKERSVSPSSKSVLVSESANKESAVEHTEPTMPLAAGWFTASDPTTGKTYYYTATGEVQWDRPVPPTKALESIARTPSTEIPLSVDDQEVETSGINKEETLGADAVKNLHLSRVEMLAEQDAPTPPQHEDGQLDDEGENWAKASKKSKKKGKKAAKAAAALALGAGLAGAAATEEASASTPQDEASLLTKSARSDHNPHLDVSSQSKETRDARLSISPPSAQVGRLAGLFPGLERVKRKAPPRQESPAAEQPAKKQETGREAGAIVRVTSPGQSDSVSRDIDMQDILDAAPDPEDQSIRKQVSAQELTQPTWSFPSNRDSAAGFPDSPASPTMLQHEHPIQGTTRDSGYHDSPTIPQTPAAQTFSQSSQDHEFEQGSGSKRGRSSSHGSSKSPMKVRVEVSPEWGVAVSQGSPEKEFFRRGTDDSLPTPLEEMREQREYPFPETQTMRSPPAVESTSKDRSSNILFQSSPSTRERPVNSVDRDVHEPLDQPSFVKESRHEKKHSRSISREGARPSPRHEDSRIEEQRHISTAEYKTPQATPITHARQSSAGLQTIMETSPASPDSPLVRKTRQHTLHHEPASRSLRRSATPEKLKISPRQDLHVDTHASPKRVRSTGGMVSPGEFSGSRSFHATHGDREMFGMDGSPHGDPSKRVRSADYSRTPVSAHDLRKFSPLGEARPASVMSDRSTTTFGHRGFDSARPHSPNISRPLSAMSTASVRSDRSLRRTDRSVSGDLRGQAKRQEANVGAKISDFAPQLIAGAAGVALASTLIKGKDKSRGVGMEGEFEGYGRAPDSPMSPTRPPSVRKRQSMQIMDLQTRVDQVVTENRALQDAKQKAEQALQEAVQHRDGHANTIQQATAAVAARDLALQEKDSQIAQLSTALAQVQQEITRVTQENEQLSSNASARAMSLETENTHAFAQWQTTSRELDELKAKHQHLNEGLQDIVRDEIAAALVDKDAEIQRLQQELASKVEEIEELQKQLLKWSQSEDFLTVRNEDYFDSACQQLCQHVQQWVLRFSKFSDNKLCKLTTDINDEKLRDRLDDAILDGSDVDVLLGDRIKRRDVFMSLVMSMVWEYVFTRYLFGMDRDQRKKLKTLEETLTQVGPQRAVAKWRAITLTLLSRRETFIAQRKQDNEAVVQEIYANLSKLLPPPSGLATQIQDSLRKVLTLAVDLAIEMRTQRAEYIMLPPLKPEYDINGDLVQKVQFNAALMNERSGEFTSNEDLEERAATVKLVLFPLVVKKGDDLGEGDDEIVVCPAQVLVAKPSNPNKKVVRVMSGAMEIDNPRGSIASFAPTELNMF